MNKREHLVNGALLSFGLATLVTDAIGRPTLLLSVEIGTPVLFGVLIPDIDSVVGRHRKTFHNGVFLAGMILFPLVFDNLHLVWVGIASHYVLDVIGSARGVAFLYPHPREFDLPIGVNAASRWALPITIVVTLFEVSAIGYLLALPIPPEYLLVIRRLFMP